MKTLFDIRSERETSEEHSLLLEIGNDYCSYAYWHQQTNTIDHLQFVSFRETELESTLPGLLEKFNQQKFQAVHVCSAFPQSLLVPTKYFANSYETLDLVYDQPAQAYFHDRINDWQMVNLYAMPHPLHRDLQQAFAEVQFIHAYTPSIRVYNGYVADNQLIVHFTPNYFRVLLRKEANIHLAQTYAYTTPLDVVYYLLKICYEFSLEQSSVYLILSGLVEKDSALYAELEQYFANVHFAHPPEIKLPDNNLPHYFFTSLYNLATCVS